MASVNSLASGRCGCNLKLAIFKFISRTDTLRISWNFPQVNARRPHWKLVNIGSGNGLGWTNVVDQFCVTICHRQATMSYYNDTWWHSNVCSAFIGYGNRLMMFKDQPAPISIIICFNSSPPSAVYVRQWIGWALVQIIACRLFGAKPLSKPMLGYCQLDL